MAYDPQIEYAASLAGMTPDAYVQLLQQQQAQKQKSDLQQTIVNTGKEFTATGSTASALANQQAQQQLLGIQAHENSQPYYDLAQSTADAYNRQINQLQPWQTSLNDNYTQNATARNQIAQTQSNALDAATTANNSYLANMQTAASNADQASNNLLGGYASALNNANSIDANTVAGLQATNAGMQQLTAGGYGAPVVSDPSLVAAQQNVYDALGGFASGAHDITSQAALAQADPEALAAQKYALGQLKNQTNPQLTDQERAMFMQARLQREMADSANRDANFRELAQRGMGGSTMALSNLNAGSMESGIQRALTDTQTAGYAQQRAQQAMRDYANLGSTIADQSFRRSYSTGAAADQAAQFNVNTQLQGTIGQGNEANQMRTASDAINTFNKAQSMIQQRYQDTYAADQQNAAWNRGVDVANAQFKQSGDISKNATDYTTQAMGAIDNSFNRQSDIGKTGVAATGQYVQGVNSLAGTQMAGLRDNSSDLHSAANLAQGIAGLTTQGQSEANKFTALGQQNAAEDVRAANAASAASAEAERQRQFENSHRSVLSYII